MGAKKELKKHVAMIHCANEISLLQRKISNVLLYSAYDELLEEDEHRISVKSLCELLGYQGHNYGAIKKAIVDLIATVLEWNIVDDKTGEEEWTASSILTSVTIKGPVCTYSYSKKMKQFLHSPSVYGKINLVVQSRFSSSYGLALYENCVRYNNLNYTKWFDIPMFRKLMGVQDGKYSIFRDFKRRVIDKAVEEVNTHSDMVIEPEYQKRGRVVEKVRFLIRDREKRVRLGKSSQESHEFSSNELFDSLRREFGLSHQLSKQVLQEFDVPFVQEKMNIIRQSTSYSKGQIKNLAAYLLSALKHDYQTQRASLTQEVSKISEKAEQEETVTLTSERFQKTRDESKRINDALDLLPKEDIDQMKEAFIHYLQKNNNQLVLNKFIRSGLRDTIVKSVFRHYVRDNFSHLIAEMET